MFLLLSFIVAIMSIYFLCDMASSYYYTSEPNAAAAVALLIYSLVCIIKEIKEKDNSFFDDDYDYNSRIRSYNQKYNNYWYNNDYSTSSNKSVYAPGASDKHNEWLDKYGSRNSVEVFSPDKKEKNDDERPMVWHYPSKKEAREAIAELEKSFWWRTKREFWSFLGRDITEKYYKPRYVKGELAVKGTNEDHTRYMPNESWLTKKETEEYNAVAKVMGRSCDIAFDGEEFVDEIDKDNESE